MGGTSTDVSRYDGEYEHVFESTTGGVAIQAPQVDFRMWINIVSAINMNYWTLSQDSKIITS